MAKILIIDDEAVLRKQLKRTLSLYDHEIYTASSGRDGIAKFNIEKPDVIVLDIKMPGMDGIEVLTKIKEISSKVEVIMVTGHGGVETAIEALKLGAFRYLTKPVDCDDLQLGIVLALERQSLKLDVARHVNTLEKMVTEWETTFNAIHDMISIHDRDFKIVKVNQTFADAYQMTPEQLIGKDYSEITANIKKQHISCDCGRIYNNLNTREPGRFQIYDPCLESDLEISISPLTNNQNQFEGSVHVARRLAQITSNQISALIVEDISAIATTTSTNAQAQKIADLADAHKLIADEFTLKGHAVNIVHDEAMALKALSETVDILFLHTINCDSQCDRIVRAARKHSKPTLILISSADDLTLKENKQLRLGCDAVLQLPFAAADVNNVIDIHNHKQRISIEADRPRILLVDDEEHTLLIMQSMIGEHTNVTALSSPTQALEQLATTSFDILISDLEMSELHGLDLIRNAQNYCPNIRTIVITGHQKLDTAIAVLKQGADDFLTKPIKRDELISIIDRLWSHTKQQRQFERWRHERETMQQALIDNQQQFNAFFSAASHGLFICNETLQIERLNAPFAAIINTPFNQALTQTLQTVSPILAATLEPRLRQVLKTNEAVLNYTLAYDIPGHPASHWIVSSFPIAAGDTTHVGSILVDVTEQKRAEQALQEKQAQLIHAGRLTSLGEMATGVAHELNQPLAIIRTNIEGLDWALKFGSFDTSSIPEVVVGTLKQVDRASNIIDHMRTFARTHTRTENITATNLATPILEGLSFFEQQFRQHDIEIITEIDQNLPTVTVNMQEFEQVVVNLLSNARFAVDEKSAGGEHPDYQKCITLRLYQESAPLRLIFSVSDNGVGMTDTVRQRCLEPFFTTKDVGAGTGLGLSIIHGIIQSFGATLEIDSTPGLQTTFKIIKEL